MPPSWGAAALLHPARRAVTGRPALPHRDVEIPGDGVTLRGWHFPATASNGTTVVVLHGIADNRESAVWIAERLTRRGFDVLAYDARAHGASGGEACTYGVRERRDLSRALDALGIRRALLVGNSLGAAVALQAAAQEARVAAVVAADTFSDLETAARERAPFFASEVQLREAFALAEAEGGFPVAEASPLGAAPRIRVPVLLLAGAEDRETPPDHSRRVLAALGGPRELWLVPGARHGEALGRRWKDVEAWLAARARLTPGDGPGPIPAP